MAKVINSLAEAVYDRACLTIGTFDGVHLGHQAIIQQLVERAHAAGALSVVLTFHPHPSVVLRGKTGNIYLSLPEERAQLIGALGVDLVVIEPFTKELAATSAQVFIQHLKSRLGLKYLLIGHDFTLGRNREGNFDVLQIFGQQMDFEVSDFEPFLLDGEVVSSSRIRALVELGEVNQAARRLGRPYQVYGEVVPGDHRGRSIGFPTANLSVPAGKILPATGVYACRAWVGGQPRPAAANIGVRPTFIDDGSDIHLEAHLLDFSGDLYGQVVSLDFIERLRGEQRFAGIQALIEQISRDIERTREIVSEIPAAKITGVLRSPQSPSP